jgi:Pentapeptide repeats (8 copies)
VFNGTMSRGGASITDENYARLERIALDQAMEFATIEDRARAAEILKNLAEARNSARGARLNRMQFAATTIIPFLALIVTAATIVVQNRQFHKTLAHEADEFKEGQTLQRDAGEDAQWRDALKLVSFRNTQSAQLGALAMQGFFESKRYETQARQVARTLLIDISNVAVFDEILWNMRERTNAKNFTDLSVVAQMLGYAQRKTYHIVGAASKSNTPFLIAVVDEIDPDPHDIEHNRDQQIKVAAWEIDTASEFMRGLWKNSDKNLSPAGLTLTATILENGDFDGLSFSGTDLSFGILSNATFRNAHFVKADLKQLYVRRGRLEGADFNGVTSFEGSRWEDSNWWEAKCIPHDMLNYLVTADHHAISVEDRTRLTDGCK